MPDSVFRFAYEFTGLRSGGTYELRLVDGACDAEPADHLTLATVSAPGDGAVGGPLSAPLAPVRSFSHGAVALYDAGSAMVACAPFGPGFRKALNLRPPDEEDQRRGP